MTLSMDAEDARFEREEPEPFAPPVAYPDVVYAFADDGTFLGEKKSATAAAAVVVEDAAPAVVDEIAPALELDVATILPAHGPGATRPRRLLTKLLEHRQAREDKLFGALGTEPTPERELLPRVYDDAAPELMPVAARSLLAGLQKLAEDGRARDFKLLPPQLLPAPSSPHGVRQDSTRGGRRRNPEAVQATKGTPTALTQLKT